MRYQVAALYIDPTGPYPELAADCWDEARDARLYAGPLPVVAHPPCARWGRYWSGGPSRTWDRKLGDDGGCFAAALAAVRRWGGVVEQPADSFAWDVSSIPPPPRLGGWIATVFGGWTCYVEQGWYGHRARKGTWLYYVGPEPEPLKWGRAPGDFVRLDDGFHSAEERRKATRRGVVERLSRLSRLSRLLTPPAFAKVLCRLASAAARGEGRQRG